MIYRGCTVVLTLGVYNWIDEQGQTHGPFRKQEDAMDSIDAYKRAGRNAQ